MDASYLVALTTLGSVDDARALVRRLVNDRLVACGTIVPGAVSIYRWEGEVTEASEAVVLLKTPADRWPALAAAVRELHPYDVPELIALPVGHGLAAYLDWMRAETASPR